jgi:hypothetical protein
MENENIEALEKFPQANICPGPPVEIEKKLKELRENLPNGAILEDIQNDCLGQIVKMEMRNPHDWVAYILQQLVEATPEWPLNHDIFRKKMIRVAALAIKAIEWIDKDQKKADKLENEIKVQSDSNPYEIALEVLEKYLKTHDMYSSDECDYRFWCLEQLNTIKERKRKLNVSNNSVPLWID